MAISDIMYSMIEQEIDKTFAQERDKRIVDKDKAKKVAKMLSELATDRKEEDALVQLYIKNIKLLCK